MKNILSILTVMVLLAVGIVIFSKTRAPEFASNIDLPTTPRVEKNSITPVDTSSWKRVQLHQAISVLLPDQWKEGSDGIYNYDYTTVTGIRDPNFPNNSFKCVFYYDKTLRSAITIEDEQVLNTDPKVTYVKGEWNDTNEDTLRIPGSEIKLYSFNDGADEKYIECNIYKGEMLKEDKNKLENSILSIQ